jgi:hypothetical protein
MKTQPPTPAEIIAAMATVLSAMGADIGDEREVYRELSKACFDRGAIIAFSEAAVERVRIMRARDADRLQRQFLDGERIR